MLNIWDGGNNGGNRGVLHLLVMGPASFAAFKDGTVLIRKLLRWRLVNGGSLPLDWGRQRGSGHYGTHQDSAQHRHHGRGKRP
jgi:hypothetical protein